MASTTTELKVQALYVGYLGRAAELAGRDFWADAIESGSVTYAQVAEDFAQSPEFQSLYAGLTTPQLIDAVYKNVLGRPSDPAGLQFWVDQVQSGNVPADLVVLYMIEGMSAYDQVRFDTRVQDGNAYTEAHPNDYVLADAKEAVGLLNQLVATVNGQAETSVDEGQTVQFQFSTIDYFPGSTLNYSITGVSAADVVGGQLSGQVTLDIMNKAIVSVTLAADALTEGAETLSLSLGGLKSSITVNDTSLTPQPIPPTYAISAAQAGYVEGDTATFNVVTTNLPAGTEVQYALSGTNITAEDVAGGQLTGKAVIDGAGKAAINVTFLQDQLTEGTEVMTVSLVGTGASTSVSISDTSKSPSYSLVADQAVVVEGSTATFTLNTENVAAGTVVSYTIGGGVDAKDIAGPLTGTATVGSDGKATISVPTVSDGIQEGNETLQVTVSAPGGISVPASTTLTDNPTYRLTAGQDGTAVQPVQANIFDGSQELTGLGPVNTLNDTDHLQGVGINPTLNAVIGNALVNLVTPNMAGVNTVNVEVANSLPTPVALSLEDTIGTTAVNITRISGGLSAIVQDMNKEVTSLSAANTVLPVPNIIFDYRPGQAPATAALALTNVTVTDLNLGVGAKAGGSAVGTGINTLNLTSNGTNTIGTATNNGLGSAVTTLNLTVNPGTLTIAGLDVPSMTTINATGAGNLVLGEVGSAGNFALQAGSMTGNVTAAIDNAAPSAGAVFNTGSGNDKLTTATNLGGDIDTDGGNDTVTIGGNMLGGSSIATDGGTDTITVTGTVNEGASIDAGEDADTVTTGAILGNGFAIGADGVVNLGGGADTLTVNGNVSGFVNSGSGDDAVTVNGSVDVGGVYGQDGNDAIQVNGNVGGLVSGGNGNDNVNVTGNVTGAVQGDDGDDTLNVGGSLSGTLAGGNGNDQMSVSGGIAGGRATGGAGMDYLRVVGTIASSGGSPAVDMGSEDDVFWQMGVGSGTAVTQGTAFVVAVEGGPPSASDTAVFDNDTASNLTITNGNTADGNAINGFETIQLLNRASGSITANFGDIGGTPRVDLLAFDGTNSTTNLTGLAGEPLFLTNDIEQGGNLPGISQLNFNGTATVNLNVAGSGATLEATIESPQGFTVNLDDTAGGYSNLKLNITNTTSNQTVNFNATAGKDDFTGTTTVTGSAAGRSITLNQIDSRVINAAIAADVTIVSGARADDAAIFALDREIYLGDGNDFVDYRNAFLDGGDGKVGGTFGEIMSFAGGNDTLLIGNSTDVTPDRDEAFEDVTGLENLWADGAGTTVFLGDDAYLAGITNIKSFGATSNVTFETGGGFKTNPLGVEVGQGSTMTLINNNNNNLNIKSILTGTVGEADSTLNLQNAGTGTVNLALTIDNDTQTLLSGKAVTGGNGISEMQLLVGKGGVDSITLIDSNIDTNGNGIYEPGLGDADNAKATVITNNWNFGGPIKIDASGIDNFDGNTATGSVVLDASSETGVVTLLGSANDNVLVGGTAGNNLTGGAGNDVLVGSNAADTLTGGAGNDQLFGKGGNDTINAGSGNDFVSGGPGADLLSGGPGGASDQDVFDYLVASDSRATNNATPQFDFISDFDFQYDKFSVSQTIVGIGNETVVEATGTQATFANLLNFLISRTEIQSAFALPGANAMFLTILSPAFPGGGINGAQGDLTLILIEDGTNTATFDANDIVIGLDDDASYQNPSFWGLNNFGPFGNGNPLNPVTIDSIVQDTGQYGNDGITSDVTITVNGGGGVDGTPDSVVTAFVDLNKNGFYDWNEPAATDSTIPAGGAWSAGSLAGPFIPDLPEGIHNVHAQQSLNGFQSAVSGPFTMVVDRSAPTATIMLDDTSLTIGETTKAHFKFSDQLESGSFTLGDLAADSAVLSNLQPVASGAAIAGPVDTTGAANLFTGAVDLGAVASNAVYNGLRVTVTSAGNDTALKFTVTGLDVAGNPLTEVIAGSLSGTSVGERLFSVINKVDVDGNTDGNVSVGWVDYSHFTATLTPNGGVDQDYTNDITLANGAVTNLAGLDSTSSFDSPNYKVDTQAPTLLSIDFVDDGGKYGVKNDAKVNGDETAAVTFTFSEPVFKFDNAPTDITIEGGVLTNLATKDNITWTATFTPNAGVADVTNVIKVIDGSFFDLLGNPGVGGTSANYRVDTIDPLAPALLAGKVQDDTGWWTDKAIDNYTLDNTLSVQFDDLGKLDQTITDPLFVPPGGDGNHMEGGKLEVYDTYTEFSTGAGLVVYKDGLVGQDILNGAELASTVLPLNLKGAFGEGEHALTAVVYDNYGNKGADSVTMTVTVDLTAPDAATKLDLTTDSVNSLSKQNDTDNWTNDDTPTVRVFLGDAYKATKSPYDDYQGGTGGPDVAGAYPGDRVTLLADGVTDYTQIAYLTAADIAAGFIDVTFGANLNDDVYKLSVTIEDKAGWTSALNNALTIEVDDTPPAPVINQVNYDANNNTIQLVGLFEEFKTNPGGIGDSWATFFPDGFVWDFLGDGKDGADVVITKNDLSSGPFFINDPLIFSGTQVLIELKQDLAFTIENNPLYDDQAPYTNKLITTDGYNEDGAGNKGGASQSYTINVVDLVAPAAPAITFFSVDTFNSVTGDSKADLYTNSGDAWTFEVSLLPNKGPLAPQEGDLITLYYDADNNPLTPPVVAAKHVITAGELAADSALVLIDPTAGTAGDEVGDVVLADDAWSFLATITDQAFPTPNESGLSNPVIVSLDTTDPVVKITGATYNEETNTFVIPGAFEVKGGTTTTVNTLAYDIDDGGAPIDLLAGVDSVITLADRVEIRIGSATAALFEASPSFDGGVADFLDVKITQEDLAGNQADASRDGAVVVADVVSPAAPNLVLDPASDTFNSVSGLSKSDGYTSDTTPTFFVNLQGKGEAAPRVGDTVELFRDAASVATAVLTAGDIAAGKVALTDPGVPGDGSFLYTSSLKDTSGNVSDLSLPSPVTVDTGKPAATITTVTYNAATDSFIFTGTFEAKVGTTFNPEGWTIDVDPPSAADFTITNLANGATDLNFAGVVISPTTVIVPLNPLDAAVYEADPNFGAAGGGDLVTTVPDWMEDLAGNKDGGTTYPINVINSVNGPSEGDDFLWGTAGPDTIDGLGGNDLILGLAGVDDLIGGTGNDVLFAGGVNTFPSGIEQLSGGEGDDYLVGGPGKWDWEDFKGGPGADTFLSGSNLDDDYFFFYEEVDGVGPTGIIGNLSGKVDNGDQLIFGNGVDTILDFDLAGGGPGSEDHLLLSSDPVGGPISLMGWDANLALNPGDNYQVRGFWDYVDTFTVIAGGPDLLVVQGGGVTPNNFVGNESDFILLIGVNANLDAADIIAY